MLTLRRRTLAAIGLALGVAGAITYGFSSRVFLDGLETYEAYDMTQSLSVAASALHFELTSRGNTAVDWAVWDDTYRFIQDGNEGYVEAYLQPSALAQLGLNVMLFFDARGALKQGLAVDLATGEAVAVPRGIVRTLGPTHPLVALRRELKPTFAILDLGNRYLLATSHPITDTLAVRAPRGTLVVGTLFDPRTDGYLRSLTHLSISVGPEEPDRNVRWVRAKGELPVSISRDSASLITGLTYVSALRGPNGAPSRVLVKVQKHRQIYERGRFGVLLFLIPMVASWVLALILIARALDRMVLTKVDKLESSLASLGLGASQRSHVGGTLASLDVVVQGVMSMYDRSPVGIAIFDGTGRASHANRRLLELSGVGTRAADASVRDLVPPEVWETLRRSDSLAFECRSSERTLDCMVTRLASPEGAPLHMLQALDVTDKWHIQQSLDYQATHDPLTHLPNRSLFEEEFQSFIDSPEGGGTAAVLCVDLDYFKTVNDAMGHQAGDRLLQALAAVLVTSFPSALVSRTGGDEFIVLIPGIDGAEAASLAASRLLEALRQPVPIENNTLYTTASIGIALIPQDGRDVHTIVRHADSALYQAKAGRNCHRFYEAGMEEASQRRLMLKADLGQAISCEEFIVYYQPQVEAVGSSVIGVEALVRWLHPTLGLLPPGDFLPLAEELGLVNTLDEWVLNAACRQLRLWHVEGFAGLRMSVNLSSKQFLRPDLVDVLRRALDGAGLVPQDLELEITESTAMFSENLTCSVLSRLKALGIRASLDDFGTGYSSLSYLKQFPLASLKIPREFVMNTPTAEDNAAIVWAVTSLAHSFGLPVVAEGVEREEELQFVRDCGCDFVQGYIFCRPKPAEEITEYLRLKGAKAASPFVSQAAASRDDSEKCAATPQG